MRTYIRENLKSAFLIAFLVISTAAFISTNELIAKRLPDISKVEIKKYYIEEVQEYTGQAVEPKLERMIFIDEEGNRIIKNEEELTIVSYTDNVDAGYADIEVLVEGYKGTLVLEDAFCIQPMQVTNVKVEKITRESIDLTWDNVNGAVGYMVYKSVDEGETFVPIKDITSGNITSYTDTDIQLNTTYIYQVSAYMTYEDGVILGNPSEPYEQTTLLKTAVLVSVNDAAYNSLQLQWDVVEGAAGYHIFRSLTDNGEFEFVGEVTDGSVTVYTDANCECGMEYYYHIKAVQKNEKEQIVGEASNIVSGVPTPNQVALSGIISEDRTQVSLNWKKSLGAQGYEIYRNTGSGYTLVQKIENASTLNWGESGLSKDIEYSYKVRPYCVVNGKTIAGKDSNPFVKEIIIEYNYTGGYGNVGGMTQYVGVSYIPGGRTPSGWDCSGFTQWALQQCYGVSIPKAASAQGSGGVSISLSDRSQWQPGDILAYSEGGRVTHVALYLGNGQLMHALNSKYGTIVQGVDFYESWDSGNKLVAVKRYH